MTVTIVTALKMAQALGMSLAALFTELEHQREWKHAFGDEERELFMPGVSYEEFVAAGQ